jgi:6-phosphogluconolactonase
MSGAQVEIHRSAEELMAAAADAFVGSARAAIDARGQFAVALSGGSTPKALFRLLAAPPRRDRIDWTRVHAFWGDERCVPPEAPESNYRMARETLLDPVGLPPPNVHRIRGEDEPEVAARSYESLLRGFFGADGPTRRLDLILLGLGDDCHTASLFPGTAAVSETAKWVVAHRVPAVPPDRITLTPPILNAAAEVAFLVAGAGKAAALHRVLDGPHRPLEAPAQAIAPVAGTLRWLVDAAAAELLDRGGSS